MMTLLAERIPSPTEVLPMRRFLLAVLVLALAATSSQAFEASPLRPVNTYSIVARDPISGEMGVAVQSHWFSVGSVVPWARAGVGAVATQSMVDASYGPLGLDLMQAGRSASAALRGLLEADDASEIRQVAMIDSKGDVAAHTGARCIPAAGHVVGENFSVQANLMDRTTVPAAMAQAFHQSRGPLAERLLAALEAAQGEGGDIRGKQSAAILVVKGESTGRPWADTVVDLRVEDHPEPVQELKRLLRLHRGYEQMNEGDLAVEKGDLAAAEVSYGHAQDILEGNLEASYWYAVALCNSGQIDAAVEKFHRIFAGGENWKRLTPRLVETGYLEASPEVLERILGED